MNTKPNQANASPTDAGGLDRHDPVQEQPMGPRAPGFRIEMRPVLSLRSHPLHNAIYGDGPSEELTASIRELGVIEPILITEEDTIAAGHHRVEAAANVGLEEVPVRVVRAIDPLDIEEILIHSNRHRVKSNEQVAREAQHLRTVEGEKARRRQANGGQGIRGGRPLAAGSAAKADWRDAAARVMGIGGKKVEQAVFVADAIDRLDAAGRGDEARRLRGILNAKSVNGAYLAARALSPDGTALPPDERDASPVLLTAWQEMAAEERAAVLSAPHRPLPFTAVSGNGAELARHSWSPVSGCIQGCHYCPDRAAAERLYVHGFALALYPDRLDAPLHMAIGREAAGDPAYRNVFAVPMGDLFGERVPREWIEAVLASIRNAPSWNFLLLARNMARLLDFEFPANAWVGATVDTQARAEAAERVFAKVKAPVKWIACEPMLERLTFKDVALFQWLVIGGRSRTPTAPELFPPREDVQHLWMQADAAGVRVFEKSNLLARRRDFPAQPATA